MAPVDGSYTVSCHPLLGLDELPLLVSRQVMRRTNACDYASVKRQRVALQDVSHVVNLQHPPADQQSAPQEVVETRNIAAAAASAAVLVPKREKTDTGASRAVHTELGPSEQPKPQPQSTPVHEYLAILLEKEALHRSTFVRVHQPEVTSKMRMILVDWLVEVNQEFRLSTDTLHLTVSIVDRYIHAQPISKLNLQLLGITSLWIAAKFEEVHPPSVRDCVEFTDHRYTPPHLVQMEYQILRVINFQLALPTISHFTRELLAAANLADPETATLSNYLTELTLLHGALPHRLPSEVAAAAVVVARCILDPSASPPAAILALAGVSLLHLLPIIHTISGLHKWASTVVKPLAVKAKYSSANFLSVALITTPSMAPKLPAPHHLPSRPNHLP